MYPAVTQIYNNQPNFQQNFKISKMIVTQPLTLQVWQQNPNIIPPGTPRNAKRPLGFASLSFTLENKSEQSIVIKLLSIEVHPVGSETPLMSLPARDLLLHPLEIAPQRYQLSNSSGYGDVEQVEAVIVYELDGKSYTWRSSPVWVKD